MFSRPSARWVLLSAIVAAFVLPAAAQSKPTTATQVQQVSHRITVLKREFRRDHGSFVFWRNHRWAYRHRILFASPPYVTCRGAVMPRRVCASLRRAVVERQRIANLRATRARLLAVLAQERAAAAQPAHLALWRCIEVGESHGDGVHPGETWASNGTHFNVLQMTNPWAGHDPIGQSYSTIESWAEQQYAASGYSRSWLNGQWGQTIGPCWKYAT